MTRRVLGLLLLTGLVQLPTVALAHGPELDPAAPETPQVTADAATGSSDLRFVKNIPYTGGTDVEFGEFTVTKLDANGDPICVTDPVTGACVMDGNGSVVYETEQRDYAFAGAQGDKIRIVDITDPESATVAATINCSVSQADIQVREDLGLLVIGVDANTSQCGMGGTQGILIFDVKDPRKPVQLGVYKHARGAHNVTLHPTQPLAYISDSDLNNTGLGEVPIVDLSNPAAPTLVTTWKNGHAHSPHDITFNASGTRAYAAAITATDILDMTDPRNPRIISTIYDPSINISHQADPTPDGKYLLISDELAGAAAGPACPGGGVHFYDITNEAVPAKAGVFFIPQQGLSVAPPATNGLCTAHVFRINPDGKTMTIGWYHGGTRLVDIRDPRNVGAFEYAFSIPSGLGGNGNVANSWASKAYKGYIYSNDRVRGLDIMQYQPAVAAPTTAKGVVSLIDTGINPYHRGFKWNSPLAYQHPSTYLPGYPADAIALPITLDEPDWNKAVKKDCPLWRTVQPSKLYWFPGTKIVGGYSTVTGAVGTCSPSGTYPSGVKVLDTAGHGTMTASRATSSEYGACRECLVVSIQFPGSVNLVSPAGSLPPTIQAIDFAADNAAWIDVQSNSWGPIAFPAWEPTGQAGLLTASPELVRKVEEVSQTHPAFWASGNGAAGRGGVIGSPTILTPTLTPSAISVGGTDSGYVNTWPGFPPHIVSDSCNSWAAYMNSTTGSAENVGSGTSAATPFAAGGAVRILMEARQILGDPRTGVRTGGVMAEGQAGLVTSGPLVDGKLTMAELKELVFKTATMRPKRTFEDGSVCSLTAGFDPTPLQWEDLPDTFPEFLIIGYGAVDDQALRTAFKVLHGQEPMPDRTRTDAYFTVDNAARTALHQVYSKP